MKKKISTLFFICITIFLFGAVIFVSFQLNNTTEQSVTSIRKTKASSQTYHKLLAVNTTPDLSGDDPITPTAILSITPTQTQSLTPNSSPSSQQLNNSPTAILSPTIQQSPLVVSPTEMISKRLLTPTRTVDLSTTPVKDNTPTLSPLLAYKSQSPISPTLIPIRETGGQTTKGGTEVTPTTKITTIPTQVKKLPDSGWIQTSSLLFIIAVTTILFSLLF